MAAPRMPMAGRPKYPKIRMGSRMMFVTAPDMSTAMEPFVRPVEERSLSTNDWSISPKEQVVTMVVYCIPRSMISASSVWMR